MRTIMIEDTVTVAVGFSQVLRLTRDEAKDLFNELARWLAAEEEK